MRNPEVRCDECGSPFKPEATEMAGICAECAHLLYGYPACKHKFVEGRCEKCGWDGSHSPFLKGKGQAPE